MQMDIQEIRRANLMRWLETHSAPTREKSLFSQLKGTGSFGERVARRLEIDYGMGVGFLDTEPDVNSPNKRQIPSLSPEAKNLVLMIERADGRGDPSRKILSHMSAILELAESMGDPHNARAVPTSSRSDALTSSSEAEELLESVPRSERLGVPKHATTRKRSTK